MVMLHTLREVAMKAGWGLALLAFLAMAKLDAWIEET